MKICSTVSTWNQRSKPDGTTQRCTPTTSENIVHNCVFFLFLSFCCELPKLRSVKCEFFTGSYIMLVIQISTLPAKFRKSKKNWMAHSSWDHGTYWAMTFRLNRFGGHGNSFRPQDATDRFIRGSLFPPQDPAVGKPNMEMSCE